MSDKPFPLIPVLGVLGLVAGAALLLWSPGPTEAPVPAEVPIPAQPTPVAKAPQVDFALPQRHAKSPILAPSDAALDATRQILDDVVKLHALDPQNPWAIGHALMVYGPETKLANGAAAVPFLFEEYAQKTRVGDEVLIAFPKVRGAIRIEPHTDLQLKFLTEIGIPPEATFKVEGEPHTMEELYRNSLYHAWVDARGATGFASLADTPWALQGLAAYAPAGITWEAEGAHPMSMDAFTDVVVADLKAQSAFLHEQMAAGEVMQKAKDGKRAGIFTYGCGGAHALQGAGFAVSRGFGSPQARQWVLDEIPLLFWRYRQELDMVDRYLPQAPEYANALLNQRLKFLGHFLETTHKFAAYGLFEPTPEQVAVMMDARVELAKTVQTVQASGIFEQLPQYREQTNTYQLYLDYVGDSAHAIRGLDLSTGAVDVLY